MMGVYAKLKTCDVDSTSSFSHEMDLHFPELGSYRYMYDEQDRSHVIQGGGIDFIGEDHPELTQWMGLRKLRSGISGRDGSTEWRAIQPKHGLRRSSRKIRISDGTKEWTLQSARLFQSQLNRDGVVVAFFGPVNMFLSRSAEQQDVTAALWCFAQDLPSAVGGPCARLAAILGWTLRGP